MIIMSDVKERIKTILPMISPEEFPEVYSYLLSLQEEEFVSPYETVNTLLSLDKPRDFPDCMVSFIRELFEIEIAEENSDAMNDLGAQYYNGSRGFEQSFEKAVHFYKMATEKGNRQAQENLGYCYYYGRTGEPDYEKAFHYFALGAFDGHLISLYKIGDMYLNGLYVPKNEREAFFIYIRCVETMADEMADRVAGPVYLRLGRMFLEGIGVDVNLKNALICFQKAETFLVDMVLSGDVMYRKSLEKAVEGQKKVRKKLMDQLPGKNWSFDDE